MTGIYSKYGQYINKQDVRRDVDPALIELERDLGVSQSSGAIHLYLSDVNGDDGNDGISSSRSVKTFTRIWELLPKTISVPIIIHIGKHSSSGYDYIPPPSNIIYSENYVVLYGDGAGQNGEDGFDEVESGVAGAATTSTVLELATSPADDAYAGHTVLFTSGAALGQRRHVRDNVGALVTPNFGFQTRSSLTNPIPGDSYRIVRPSVLLNLPVLMSRGLLRDETYLTDSIPVHVINISFKTDSTTRWISGSRSHSVFFGVEMVTPSSGIYSTTGGFLCGIDEATYDVSINNLLQTLNPSHEPGMWGGWGFAHVGVPFDGNSVSINIRTGESVYDNIILSGYFVANLLNLNGRVTSKFMGGRFGRLLLNNSTENLISTGYYQSSVGTIPLLVRTSSLSPLSLDNGCVLGLTTGTASNPALQIETTSSSSTLRVIRVDSSMIVGSACISISAPNSTGYGYYIVKGGKVTQGVSGSQQSTLTDISVDLGTAVYVNYGGQACFSTFNITASKGVFVGPESSFDMSPKQTVGACDITCTNEAVVVDGGSVNFSATASSWQGSVSNGAVVLVRNGGKLTQEEPTGDGYVQNQGILTITNNAAGSTAHGIKVSGGAKSYLRGGTNTVVSANGFGIDSRFGGAVYFGAQPSSVVGASGDLIVTTASPQADTVLSASESAIIDNSNGSVIARAN